MRWTMFNYVLGGSSDYAVFAGSGIFLIHTGPLISTELSKYGFTFAINIIKCC